LSQTTNPMHDDTPKTSAAPSAARHPIRTFFVVDVVGGLFPAIRSRVGIIYASPPQRFSGARSLSRIPSRSGRDLQAASGWPRLLCYPTRDQGNAKPWT